MSMDEATKRKVRAGRMLHAGKKPAEIAAAVGVARQTVFTWNASSNRRHRCFTRDQSWRSSGSLEEEQFERSPGIARQSHSTRFRH